MTAARNAHNLRDDAKMSFLCLITIVEDQIALDRNDANVKRRSTKSLDRPRKKKLYSKTWEIIYPSRALLDVIIRVVHNNKRKPEPKLCVKCVTNHYAKHVLLRTICNNANYFCRLKLFSNLLGFMCPNIHKINISCVYYQCTSKILLENKKIKCEII